VHFPNVTHSTPPHQLQGAPEGIRGHPLVTHLCGHLVRGGKLSQSAGFHDIVGHGFLAIDVFAAPYGRGAYQRVIIVRRGHNHSVDLTLLGVEHGAEILVRRHTAQFLGRLVRTPSVNVAHRGEIMPDLRDDVEKPFERRPRPTRPMLTRS
jgi:hypothetical protein